MAERTTYKQFPVFTDQPTGTGGDFVNDGFIVAADLIDSLNTATSGHFISTTDVHGITDTSKIAYLNDSGELVGPILVRNDTHVNLASVVPGSGEMAFSTDTRKLVGGNGANTFHALEPLSSRVFTMADVPTKTPGYKGQIAYVSDIDAVIMGKNTAAGAWGWPNFYDKVNEQFFVSWDYRTLYNSIGEEAIRWSEGSAVLVNNLASAGYINGSARYQTVSNTGATLSLNFGTGTYMEVTMNGNKGIEFVNWRPGHSAVLIIKQDATGGRTMTWSGSQRWAGGTVPALSTAPNAIDMLTMVVGIDGAIYSSLTKDMQ